MEIKLTDRQRAMVADLNVKELLTEESINEMYQVLCRCNMILNKTLSQPYDYAASRKSNESITQGSEFRSICLKDRIERAFLVERAHNPKFIAAYFTLAIELDPEDYFHVKSANQVGWEEFVDGYLKMHTCV